MPSSWFLVFRILYRFLTALAWLIVRSGRSKDLEIIVLRHQLAVLRRQVDRPAINDDDRTLLGAVAAAVSPGTGPSHRLPLRADHRPPSSYAN
jgi:hypothetical protein